MVPLGFFRVNIKQKLKNGVEYKNVTFCVDYNRWSVSF